MKREIHRQVRPVPYFAVDTIQEDRLLAFMLRGEFVPKLARRLPNHHLRGWEHDFIVRWVSRQKKQYPCFLRTDIEKFYPNVDHIKMVVNIQVAYRELLGLDYVPKTFKEKYVGLLHGWCKELPLHKGLPIASPVSGIVAPVMLVPLWLELKRTYGVPFLVFMDDILARMNDKLSQLLAVNRKILRELETLDAME